MDCDFTEFIVSIIHIARYLCGSWASCFLRGSATSLLIASVVLLRCHAAISTQHSWNDWQPCAGYWTNKTIHSCASLYDLLVLDLLWSTSFQKDLKYVCLATAAEHKFYNVHRVRIKSRSQNKLIQFIKFKIYFGSNFFPDTVHMYMVCMYVNYSLH